MHFPNTPLWCGLHHLWTFSGRLLRERCREKPGIHDWLLKRMTMHRRGRAGANNSEVSSHTYNGRNLQPPSSARVPSSASCQCLQRVLKDREDEILQNTDISSSLSLSSWRGDWAIENFVKFSAASTCHGPASPLPSPRWHRGEGRGEAGWGLWTSPHAPDPTQS